MIFLTGANGMLGTAIQDELKKLEIKFISSDIKGNVEYICDISNKNNLLDVFGNNQIDMIINCAAWTDVDEAEDEDKKELVDKINIYGLSNLCEIAKKYNCKLLHISTDYVFDGQGDKPWKETDIPTNPINYYGQTKLQGEKLVEQLEKYFIVRTQWTYGKNGKNFVDAMLKNAETRDAVQVVNDQIGSPTCVEDLAKTLIEISLSEKYGYYHVVSSGDYVSWYDFCKEIYKLTGLSTKVIPVSSKDYSFSRAERPHNSRLDRNKYIECGFTKLPDWKESLARYLCSICKIG